MLAAGRRRLFKLLADPAAVTGTVAWDSDLHPEPGRLCRNREEGTTE